MYPYPIITSNTTTYDPHMDPISSHYRFYPKRTQWIYRSHHPFTAPYPNYYSRDYPHTMFVG